MSDPANKGAGGVHDKQTFNVSGNPGAGDFATMPGGSDKNPSKQYTSNEGSTTVKKDAGSMANTGGGVSGNLTDQTNNLDEKGTGKSQWGQTDSRV